MQVLLAQDLMARLPWSARAGLLGAGLVTFIKKYLNVNRSNLFA
jgi:hypothetical protein